MHFEWQSMLAGGAVFWVISAILHAVPPAKETDPWLLRWFANAAHAVGANLDRLKGISNDSKESTVNKGT